MINIFNLKYGDIKHGIQGLKNNILHTDLQQYFAAGFPGEAGLGEVPGYKYEQRHMKSENPHIERMNSIHPANERFYRIADKDTDDEQKAQVEEKCLTPLV